MVPHILAGIAVAAALWGLTIWIIGGFKISLIGMTITANDLFRPLAFSAAAALAYTFSAGATQVRRDIAELRRFGRLATSLAFVLALCPAMAGLARNSWTAGGADSYGYVSQADLWLHRNLMVNVPLADSVPWPDALWSFAPHGYRPAVDKTALVPVYSPGLPLMMAAAKALGGHCAMFWVVPLFGSLLVWFTFAIGRTLESDALGLAAAWLVATSPTVLAMLVSPMSDVPAAALWAAAIYFALGHTSRSAIACGLAASAAILIRPNLAPLALVIVVWKFFTGLKPRATAPRRGPPSGGSQSVASAFTPVLMIIAGVLPGCLIIAALNNWFHGSPIASGYGTLPNLFSLANVATNLRRYGG